MTSGARSLTALLAASLALLTGRGRRRRGGADARAGERDRDAPAPAASRPRGGDLVRSSGASAAGNGRRARRPTARAARHGSAPARDATSGPAWLFWLDREPYARFSHPSEYLLLDAATGRVLRRGTTGWYPTVNAKDPAFLATSAGYESQRYRVFSRVTPVAPSTTVRPPSDIVVPRDAFADDCVLMVGDYGGPLTRNDFPAVQEWAS